MNGHLRGQRCRSRTALGPAIYCTLSQFAARVIFIKLKCLFEKVEGQIEKHRFETYPLCSYGLLRIAVMLSDWLLSIESHLFKSHLSVTVVRNGR